MDPDLLLRILAALAEYLLKTSLAFAACVLFSRLVNAPGRRLAVWFSFLLGATAYWLYLGKVLFEPGRPAATAPSGVLPPAASSVSLWHLQSSWASPLGLTVRAAALVYLIVLLYLFCNHLKKWWHLKWVLSFTTSAPPGINARFQALASSLRVGRARLLILSGVTSPATFGWLRPTVLLPDVCIQQDESDLDDILLHELHHVRRRDFVWNRLAMLCRALVFFHPACWYAVQRIRLERELACDLAVIIQTPERKATYAECLMRFARLHASQDQKAWGIDFAASHHLKTRVRSILAESKKLPLWAICLRTACAATLLTGFLGVVPSMAVLLSFAHPATAIPVNLNDSAPHRVPETKTRTVSKPRVNVRSNFPPAPMQPGSGEAGLLAQPATQATESKLVTTAETPSDLGPQLQHRPAAGTVAKHSTQQQSVTLLDPGASAQGTKAADRNQVLQQSATTAASIYRKLGAVDRR